MAETVARVAKVALADMERSTVAMVAPVDKAAMEVTVGC
jgi:hypothetical protein